MPSLYRDFLIIKIFSSVGEGRHALSVTLADAGLQEFPRLRLRIGLRMTDEITPQPVRVGLAEA